MPNNGLRTDKLFSVAKQISTAKQSNRASLTRECSQNEPFQNELNSVSRTSGGGGAERDPAGHKLYKAGSGALELTPHHPPGPPPSTEPGMCD